MFTGIITGVGKIISLSPLGTGPLAGKRLSIGISGDYLADVGLGDSIAINGACMTVVAFSAAQFEIDISAESLSKTTGLETVGNEVNLEKALRANDRLGGHIVSGHVDGVGEVVRFDPVGESWELVVSASATLGKFLAYKGSITVNGVSLTVNRVEDTAGRCEFSINLIPHTVEVTALKHLRAGVLVNLEIDTVARYVERMLSTAQGGSKFL
jgi:riboflavin synthase